MKDASRQRCLAACNTSSDDDDARTTHVEHTLSSAPGVIAMPLVERPVPTLDAIRKNTEELLGRRPCHFQMKVCEAFLRGDKNIVASAATGFGKSLTFFMPLLFSEDAIIIIITPLNILGQQTVNQLAALQISAVAVDAQSVTQDVIKVCTIFFVSNVLYSILNDL